MVEAVRTDGAQSFEGMGLPISQAVVHGDTVYVSGLEGIDPGTGDLVAGGAGAQTERIMENVAAILEAAGSSLDSLLSVTVYLRDVADFEAVNAAYREYVTEPYPARTAVEVSDLAADFDVEIDAIAAIETG